MYGTLVVKVHCGLATAMFVALLSDLVDAQTIAASRRLDGWTAVTSGVHPTPIANDRVKNQSRIAFQVGGAADSAIGPNGFANSMNPTSLPGNVLPPQQTNVLPPASGFDSQPANSPTMNSLPSNSNISRPVQDPRQVVNQNRPIDTNVATGLPYVTPAPRTGNFATSPYYGSPQLQFVNYQTVSQAPAPAPAAVALPQNQPIYGYYPTAYQNCGPGGPSFPPNGAVPGTFAPATLPPNLTPGMYTPNNAGYRPLISLGQENFNVQLGRGIIGQPTVYVPGQWVRNFLRYLSP